MENQNRQSEEGTIVLPKQDVFSGTHAIDSAILQPGVVYHIYEKTEYPDEGGILVYYKGVPYPKKGFPFPEAIYAIDIAKRFTLAFISMLSAKALILPMIVYSLLPWKIKLKPIQNALFQYARMNEWIMSPCFLKREYCCKTANGVRTFLEIFMTELGFESTVIEPVPRNIATFFEYDDAYRYRLQDIISEVNEDRLDLAPRNEIKRLLKLFAEREKMHAMHTAGIAGKLLSIVLLHPKVRRAFRAALKGTNLESMKLDNADRYHVLLRGDYDFQGLTFEERKQLYVEWHEDHGVPFPPTMEINK